MPTPLLPASAHTTSSSSSSCSHYLSAYALIQVNAGPRHAVTALTVHHRSAGVTLTGGGRERHVGRNKTAAWQENEEGTVSSSYIESCHKASWSRVSLCISFTNYGDVNVSDHPFCDLFWERALKPLIVLYGKKGTPINTSKECQNRKDADFFYLSRSIYYYYKIHNKATLNNNACYKHGDESITLPTALLPIWPRRVPPC